MNINHSDKILFCNDKWLELLREALLALNIALKKIDILKNYITKTFSSPTKKSNVKGKKDRKTRENEISRDEYFSPSALSQLCRSYNTRHKNNETCTSMDTSLPNDDSENNYGCKEDSGTSLSSVVVEETLNKSSGKKKQISPVSKKLGSGKKNKKRSEESLRDLPNCLNNNSYEEKIPETHEDETYPEEHQSIDSFENTFCDLSEAEISNFSEEELLKVRFRINSNRVQDTEVKAALEKEGFHNFSVKVKNKETYSRGQILFSGDEVKKVAGKKFNILIHNEPLQIRYSVKVSSVPPSSALDIKNSTEIVTEESVMDDDPIVNDECESGRVEKTQALNVETFFTGADSISKVERDISPQQSTMHAVNPDISKDIAQLSACSIELMKSVSESLSLGATLIGGHSLRTDEMNCQIFRNNGLNDDSSCKFSPPDTSVLGINSKKDSVGSNECCLETTSNAAPKLDFSKGNGNPSKNIINKSKNQESVSVNNGDECKNQNDIHKGNDYVRMTDEGILINISYGAPPTRVGNITDRDLAESCMSDMEVDVNSDLNKNYNSSAMTKKVQANESENCKSKLAKDDNDTGYNYRTEIDESMLINISCGYQSTRDAFPKKGKYNEMGRNSPVRSISSANESDSNEGKLNKNTLAVETTRYKNDRVNNSSIPDLNCSIGQPKEVPQVNSFIKVNSEASKVYCSDLERRGRSEQNTGNNFNFNNNRPQSNNFTFNNSRSVQPTPNIFNNSIRNAFNFQPNECFPWNPSTYNQRYISPWNNQQNNSPGIRYSFTPFSPSSSAPNHRKDNEFRNSSYNFNTPWRQPFYQRNNFQ